MYCKNCGNPLDDNAAVCTQCGYAKGSGDKFCPNCRAPLIDGAEFCTGCGTRVGGTPVFDGVVQAQGKSRIAAGVLGILVGAFGIHNFYLGYTSKALIQLLMSVLSCGLLSWASAIWGLVEGIMILTNSINTDADGNPLRD